jgi:hypothetical protein
VVVADSAAVPVVSVAVLVDSAVDAVVLAAVVDSEEAEVALAVVVAVFAVDEELHAAVEVVAVLAAEAHQPKKSSWNHIVTKESSSHVAKTMISY